MAGDVAYSVTLDTSKNVYSTGTFNGTSDFDPGVGIVNLTAIGMNDIFISKLDGQGNFKWAKNFGGTNEDMCLSIALDVSGNIYTTGYFGGTVDFNPGSGTYNLASDDSYSIDIIGSIYFYAIPR